MDRNRIALPSPGATAFLGLIASSLIGLGGCVFSDGEPGPAGADGKAQVRLALAPAALARAGAAEKPAPFDSVHIRVSAEDMAPMDFVFAGDSLAFTLDGLPPGADRIVTAYLFRAGRLLYAGRGVFAFLRETRSEAALRCEPQFSRVGARFHLPMDMGLTIAGGTLVLTGPSGTFSAGLRIVDEFGSFLVDEVPGAVRYDVAMVLTDAFGAVKYRAERSGVFLPLGEAAEWDLSLLPDEAMAGFSLNLEAAAESRLSAGFPSRRRPPEHPGEAIVSEFYAAPGERDSSSQGEWWEIFNRSQDTLELAGCRISRDRGAGVTRSYPFDSARVLPPGKALVFGRAAARADVHYQDFTLVNTASSLLLLCDGDSLLLDSLRYSSTVSDSTALPMREGMATSLGAENVSRRALPGSWCLTKTADPGSGAAPAGTGSAAGAAPGASPGDVAGCGGAG